MSEYSHRGSAQLTLGHWPLLWKQKNKSRSFTIIKCSRRKNGTWRVSTNLKHFEVSFNANFIRFNRFGINSSLKERRHTKCSDHFNLTSDPDSLEKFSKWPHMGQETMIKGLFIKFFRDFSMLSRYRDLAPLKTVNILSK